MTKITLLINGKFFNILEIVNCSCGLLIKLFNFNIIHIYKGNIL